MPMLAWMGISDPTSPVAVLGPTNTGKTQLAIERMCGHSSGMIGFPLRLLAREVYDRVVRIKGADKVALITGEEKILPRDARWFLCTAESMPLEREFGFVALDEAQLGADPARGHVFTDRLLRARGRDETMILGSDTLRPMLRQLLPKVEIISRPRFSTLSYAGSTKLSRLPPRSAIVAFSAEEVYVVAEMLRRTRGGAAVVMGALSPHTRNAQVAMFQAGEVDYLVATDAIGMGLNMDVAHVAFASLRKFDGSRSRRLTIAEMAQIAGRAGRHQRDGTFGTIALDGGDTRFEDEEIAAIEGHHFPPLDHLYWREGSPSFASLDELLADLERRPMHSALRAAPEAIDLAVLRKLADEEWVRERSRTRGQVACLWSACGLPDFRKTGAEFHSRLVARIFRHLSEGKGHLPVPWFAEELARLDTTQGDVETLADRIASVRTWAYIAHRADWLSDADHWAERTREIETKLSDALHLRLTQRFVDRRTAVLMRDLGARGADLLPVTIGEDGTVAVDGEAIGRLEGFRFRVDHEARLADKKRLLAAAERRLGVELSRRARQLCEDGDEQFLLATDPGLPVAILWRGQIVARLSRGRTALAPRVKLHQALDALASAESNAIEARLSRWIETMVSRVLPSLGKIATAVRDINIAAPLRALLAPIAQGLGLVERHSLDSVLAGFDRSLRNDAGRLDIRIGTLDLFVPALLKPEAMRWRMALIAIRDDSPMPPLPPTGAVVVPRSPAWRGAGYRALGEQMLRIDVVERIARQLHDAREAAKRSDTEFIPDSAPGTSAGLKPESFARLLAELGFRHSRSGWTWRGRPVRREQSHQTPVNHAFASLAVLRTGHG